MCTQTYARYQGKEYSAGIKNDGIIVLRSSDPSSLDIGFHKKTAGQEFMYIKYVPRDDLAELYDLRHTAVYQGYEFDVLEETENQYSIVATAGDYHEWERLGMRSIDKGIYQKWVEKLDVELRLVKEAL